MRSAPIPTLPLGLILGTTALLGTALTASSALGQSNLEATIVVTASVEEACSLQTEDIMIDFGVYTGMQVDRTPSFKYTCPAGKNVTFRLTEGLPLIGLERYLPHTQNGGAVLRYDILQPGGSIWLDNYNIPETPGGGEKTENFGAILHPSTPGSAIPGQYRDEIKLTLIINN